MNTPDLVHAMRVDVLVNNAGVHDGGLVENQDLDALYELPQVNLVAPMHLTRAMLPDELGPGGPERFAKLASRGPAKVLDVVARRVFSR